MELIFATGNRNKVKEIASLIPDDSKLIIKPMADLGITEDLPETQATLSGNARQKSEYLYQLLKVNVFSEDTGLEVEALDNAPGVITARYAGENKDPQSNMDLVLKNLVDVTNRKARFRTILSLILDGQEHQFEGIVNGRIALEKLGTNGFGYDPIFIPDGFNYSFGQLPKEIKYGISHRKRAFEKMIAFLVKI